jgi:hypothetical protein
MKLKLLLKKEKRENDCHILVWPQNWQRKLFEFVKSSHRKDVKEGTQAGKLEQTLN